MSNWFVVVPEATTNKVLNPSFETTGNFAAAGGGSATRSTSYQKFGLYSLRVQTSANNDGVDITLGSLANDPHYVSLFVRGTIPPTWDWSLDGATFTSPTLLKSIDSNWNLYGLNFPAAQATGSTTLSIYQNGAGAGDFYIDAVQVEQKDGYRTTYCDGTQDGCEWNGAKNASTSTRSALSRAGGRVYDLQDDYYLNISQVVGAGAAPQRLGSDSYAILPGGEFNNLKIQSRVFTITGVINASSQADFHDKEQNLYNILSDAAYPGQPVLLRYEGGTVHKEIAAFYEGGLESDISATDPCFWERVAIRFNATDPFWYEVGNSAAVLDVQDAPSIGYLIRLNPTTGQWDEVGISEAIYDIIYDSINDVLYIATVSGVYSYDGETLTQIGTSNHAVYALAITPAGILFAGGNFTIMDGGAANYIASYTVSTDTWAAMGAGLDDNCRALALSEDQNVLYMGGDFLNAGGAGANYVAKYTISTLTYGTLSTGMNGDVYTLAVTSDGLYAGGLFTTASGNAAVGFAFFDGSSWDEVGGGLTRDAGNASVRDLLAHSNGKLYLAGLFGYVNGVAASGLAIWDGLKYDTMGSGVDGGDGYSLISLGEAPDGSVWIYCKASVGGLIDESIGDGVNVIWNGNSYERINIAAPGELFRSRRPANDYNGNYEMYASVDSDTTFRQGGDTTITYDGTVAVYPKIIIERPYNSDETNFVLELIKNQTIGRRIVFNYALNYGEGLTIDLSPNKGTIISNLFGSKQEAVLASSDLGSFRLVPGDNTIIAFVYYGGAPTYPTAMYIQWRTAYAGY